MSALFVEKAIEINSPASRVWEILTKPEYTTVWAQEFAQMTLESEWELGSSVSWKRKDGTIAVGGNVTTLEPNKLLRFSVMDMEHPVRALIKETDGITFELSGADSHTTLHVLHGDFSVLGDEAQKAYTGSDAMWERTLKVMKELAESSQSAQ